MDEAWKRQIERRLAEVEAVVANMPKDPLEAGWKRFSDRIAAEKRAREDEVPRG